MEIPTREGGDESQLEEERESSDEMDTPRRRSIPSRRPITPQEVFEPLVRSHTTRMGGHHRLSQQIPALRKQVLDKLRTVVSRTTMSTRISVLKRCRLFLLAIKMPTFSLRSGPPTDPSGVLLWLESIQHPATQYQYAKIMKAWYKSFWRTVPQLLEDYTRATGRVAARLRPKQAWPISKEEFMAFAARQPPMLHLGLWIQWKTLSRWGEIALLTRRNFILVSPEEIVVAFATHHTADVTGIKTAHTNRFKINHFMVIHERDRTRMEWATNLLMSFPKLSTSKLFPWTTRQVESLMRAIPLREELQMQMREESQWPEPPPRHEHYTAHSPKRATMNIITSAVAEGLLPPSAIAVSGKHKSAVESIPSNSVRYVHENPALAKANGSHLITILL